MSADADYHRTFQKFTTDPHGMWPEFKANPRGWNYRGQAAFRQKFEDEYAKKVGAFYAHQRVGRALTQVRLMWKDDQKFPTHATFWEGIHSTLLPTAARLAEPVVDDKLRLIGHLGWWWQDRVFIPQRWRTPDKNIQSLIASGEEIFAGLSNPLPSHYMPNDLGSPKWKFLLMTAPDGQVVAQFGYDIGYGAVSTIAPWDLISIGRAAVTLAGVGSRQVIRLVVRKGSERVAAVGATKAAAEAAAKRAATTPVIPVQARKVTQADVLAWEREGGHLIQNHGPQLTRQTLKKRVNGREEIPAPQMQPGGVTGKDLRVWRGQREPAASKWASDEEMRKAIGDVINKNVDHIRSVTNGGGEVLLSRQAVGHKTGSGWVTTGGPSGTRAAFFDENLKGVTILIRRRKNHVPTAKDPEGWYVHTAFPDRPL